MPLYSAATYRHPGSVDPPFFPCYGIDGNGNDVGQVTSINTDTGECTYFVREADGSLTFSEDTGEVVERTEVKPLPILLVEHKP